MAARQAFCNRLSLPVTSGLDRWSSKQNSAYRPISKLIKQIDNALFVKQALFFY